MNSDPRTPQPLINVPPVTLILLLFLTVVHLIRSFVLVPDADVYLVRFFGFTPVWFHDAALHDMWVWLTLVSYAFLHFGWLHFIVNATGVLAFGTAVERLAGKLLYLMILLSGIVGGALVHLAFFSDSQVTLGGISAGLSALFAVILGLIQRDGQRGWRTLAKPAIVWIIINIVFGLMGMPGQDQTTTAIAWIAHLGGFAIGLIWLPILWPDYRFWRQETMT